MVREVGRLAKRRPAGQELRAADREEVFTHQQVAAQPVVGSWAGPNGNVDLFAREVGPRYLCNDAHIELGIPLGQATEAWNQPTRNH